MTILKQVLARLEHAASGIGLDPATAETMKALGVPADVVEALRTAMISVDQRTNAQAYAYAHGMEEAWRQYGIEGVKHQVMYLLINLGRWTGPEARASKVLLKKWTEGKFDKKKRP